jgi:GDP-L-fucose synthase
MAMQKDSKIFVAGYRGLVGSALVRNLRSQGYNNLILHTHGELDLCDGLAVKEFFETEKPEYVFLAAAKVGGIWANSHYPADFIYSNLSIQVNIIHNAYLTGVKKLLFLGSSCIYPKFAPQPMKEDYLLTGQLEPTNEPYAVAKIAGIKMCESYNKQFGTNYISVMPTNLYGINDNFDLENSHVLPALLRKFHEAKINNSQEMVVWGSGTPRREFMYVDDLADACVFLMNNYDDSELINIGVGTDISIRELAILMKEITGYNGEIVFDSSKPDGMAQKLLDVGKLNGLGWRAKTGLAEGIEATYKWYVDNC